MGATVRFEGLDELRQALRELPQELVSEASDIVQQHADRAGEAIRAAYNQHRGTGYLADHVTVSKQRTGVTATATVRSNAPHAALFEFGTGSLNVQHSGAPRQTKRGANRGSSPPQPTVIPIAIRERRAMVTDLIDLVKRAGFEVSGGD